MPPVLTSFCPAAEVCSQQSRSEHLPSVPESLTRELAWDFFVAEGRADGRDREHWYRAERELQSLIASLDWQLDESGDQWRFIQQIPPREAIQVIRRLAAPNDRVAPRSVVLTGQRALRVLWPPQDELATMETSPPHFGRDAEMPSKYERLTELDPEVEAHRQTLSRHAITRLSPEEQECYRGQLVAESLLTGEIIAAATSLDALRALVAASAQRGHPIRIAHGPYRSLAAGFESPETNGKESKKNGAARRGE